MNLYDHNGNSQSTFNRFTVLKENYKKVRVGTPQSEGIKLYQKKDAFTFDKMFFILLKKYKRGETYKVSPLF